MASQLSRKVSLQASARKKLPPLPAVAMESIMDASSKVTTSSISNTISSNTEPKETKQTNDDKEQSTNSSSTSTLEYGKAQQKCQSPQSIQQTSVKMALSGIVPDPVKMALSSIIPDPVGGRFVVVKVKAVETETEPELEEERNERRIIGSLKTPFDLVDEEEEEVSTNGDGGHEDENEVGPDSVGDVDDDDDSGIGFDADPVEIIERDDESPSSAEDDDGSEDDFETDFVIEVATCVSYSVASPPRQVLGSVQRGYFESSSAQSGLMTLSLIETPLIEAPLIEARSLESHEPAQSEAPMTSALTDCNKINTTNNTINNTPPTKPNPIPKDKATKQTTITTDPAPTTNTHQSRPTLSRSATTAQMTSGSQREKLHLEQVGRLEDLEARRVVIDLQKKLAAMLLKESQLLEIKAQIQVYEGGGLDRLVEDGMVVRDKVDAAKARLARLEQHIVELQLDYVRATVLSLKADDEVEEEKKKKMDGHEVGIDDNEEGS